MPKGYPEKVPPLDRAAARLVERHRLPPRIMTNLKLYILTQDTSWLRLAEFTDALREDDPPHPGFSVTVRGLDEFVTKADWDRLWERIVRRRQDDLWAQKGMRPRGRRTGGIERLREGIPLYRMVVVDKCLLERR